MHTSGGPLPSFTEGFIMSEEEYYEESMDESEFGDTFLSQEEADGDITMIMLPKFDYDVGEFVQKYLKSLKKCKTNEEATELMFEFWTQSRLLTIIEIEQDYIQDRACNLESLISQIKFK